MKVLKCSIAKEPSTEQKLLLLSYDDMTKKEGVYKIANGAYRDVRLVVVKAGESTVVLYYNNYTIQPAGPVWRKFTFEKIEGAEVCFEIREPK